MHKSIMRRNEKGKPVNNERLEFLGDAVLDAVVGHIVYDKFPGKREGFLTNTRSKLVQRETLGKLAKDMGINRLILSNGSSSQSHNSYMGGNAFEALVGALYLDHGYAACMKFMEKKILSEMVNIEKVAYKEVNFKSKLLEWSQKNRIKLAYEMVETKKDENGSPMFTYKVMLETVEGCTGTGFSKKEAHQQASKATLDRLRRDRNYHDSVFAAKSERTKMEEEPYMAVPTDKPETIVEPIEIPDTPVEKPATTENTSADNQPITETAKKPRRKRPSRPQKSADTPASTDSSEFDLSDISARPMSREEIIAAAEAAAFGEE